MEVLAIGFWTIVLIAVIAFVFNIPVVVRGFECWLAKRKKRR